ncbi:MAG: Ni/Fe-hydrogenase cytochrome b subunit [Deltaproteobacteria bacterium]|nr:Ni/Fe-hydrogenase cytochrome b subunit [Deltaproteobacteria bacterium]MCL5276715.1 Ni/Fe-hydrogenase cytochrome b subunit [Deltaproteobacteria bacterium]
MKSVKKLIQFVLDLAFNSPYRSTARVRTVKGVLWFLAGLGTAVGIVRMVRGLGATTNLTDLTPWGLWIGFDVVGGVALAAGGFVIAATVYIFHLHRYHAIARPAVLTAFLGYGAVIVGLIFDLGRWWDIWHPVVYWQDHSALFEVAWCVMLYFTVLALEFAPTVFEKMPFPRIYKALKALTLPLIILGIMLSTLHQSSLGTLFLIMPFRIYPLWYSGLLPWLFFISAIGLGLAMVILESLVSNWVYQREEEGTDLLAGLARACAVVLGLYMAIRLGDLAYNGKLALLARPAWETADFIIEACLSVVFPIVLFSIPKVRKSKGGLFIGASSTVVGIVLNRINVSGIATIAATRTHYFPAWTEFAISIGVVAAAALIFFFFVEHFSVYGPEEASHEDTGLPAQEPVSNVYIGAAGISNTALYSLIFVLSLSIGVYFMPGKGHDLRRTPVQPPETINAGKVSVSGQTLYGLMPVAGSDPVDPKVNPNTHVTNSPALLLVNNDGRFVIFEHKAHQIMIERIYDALQKEHLITAGSDNTASYSGDTVIEKLSTTTLDAVTGQTYAQTCDGAQQAGTNTGSCKLCHHMNYPFNQATSCRTCHRDMYLPTNIFSHGFHVAKMDGNRSCIKCHKDPAAVKSLQTAAPCTSCHKFMIAHNSLIKLHDRPLEMPAVGYMDAMHGLCRSCHRRMALLYPQRYRNLEKCATCHQVNNPDYLKGLPQYPSPGEENGQRSILSMDVPQNRGSYPLKENRALSPSR